MKKHGTCVCGGRLAWNPIQGFYECDGAWIGGIAPCGLRFAYHFNKLVCIYSPE